jgi:ABC-type lipoprotein release transport system permease subunit
VSLALLLTIALGIGSNVSVHGLVQGVTGPHSPLASDDRVVSLFGRDAHREARPLSYQDYLLLRTHLNAFEWIGAARVSPTAITSAGQSTIMSVAALTPHLAGFLNLPVDQGIVISHRVWENDFRAKADVRGEQIRIDGVNARVGGVAPDWLEGLYRDRPVDLWMPLEEEMLQTGDRSSRDFWVLGRTRQHVSTNRMQMMIGASLGGTREIRVLRYTGLTPEMAESNSRVGALLSFAAGLVFLIACANIASFLLGRASARSHETSLRIALGASRGQIARGLLSDSVVISVTGGVSGMLLALWTSLVLPAFLFEQDAAHLTFALDVRSIVAASAACVGIMIVCGLLPVFVISYDRPATVLWRESAGPTKAIQRLRVGLVVAQMTSCCILVISTAFLFEGLRAALQTSVGHRLGHPILASVEANPFAGMKYFRDVQDTAHLVAGVSGMAWVGELPDSQATWQSFRVEPRQLQLREVTMDIAPFNTNSQALFKLPPIAGRLFGLEDQTCPAAVVNEEAAKALFGANSVGRSILDPAGLPVDVIGVVAMRKGGPAAGRPTIYFERHDRTGSPPSRIALAHFRAPTLSTLERAELDSNVVSPSYFAAMGWPLVAGRVFANDPNPRGCRVGVVNQEAADLYFNGDAVGASVIGDGGRRTEIIGVVHAAPLGTFQPLVEPAIYFPMTQDYLPYMTLILGAREVKGTILEELRSRIESVPGRGPAGIVVRTLETYLSQTALAPLRIATLIIGAYATMALVLSILGLFGALSDAVRQRRREFAVRIALGAQRRHLIRQVLGEGARLACVGALAGTLGSLLLSRMLSRITPGHGSPAVWVWMAAALLLAGVVAIASVLPARRALIVNPLAIVRDQN